MGLQIINYLLYIFDWIPTLLNSTIMYLKFKYTHTLAQTNNNPPFG